MVKDVTILNTRYKLGSLSIPVDDLIEIIESKNFSSVTADNENIKFESIEDIKNNKALLAGFPTLYCDGIRLSFEKYSAQVSVYLRNSDSDVGVAKSLHAELLKRKNLLDKIVDRMKILYMAFFSIIVITILLRIYLPDTETRPAYISMVADFLSYITLAFIPFYVWHYYSTAIRDKVSYSPTQGFLKRNFEQILMLIVGTVVGILVTHAFKFLTG